MQSVICYCPAASTEDGSAMIKVLYEDNHLLCVEKPVNVPVQADESKDPDLLTMGKEYLKEKYHKPGNVYLGLVHRLDRPVGGVMVFARTSKAASRLSEAIRTGQMHKSYYAVLDGIPEKKQDELVDWLEKDHRTNMVHVCKEGQGKKCILDYETVAVRNGKTLVRIQLKTGRAHQIRVQFASRNTPLVHDQRYNLHAGNGQIALWAYQLEFPHPVTKQMILAASLPPSEKDPWNLFEDCL